MGYQPFLISAFKTGHDDEVEPWILPQDAFQTIINAFIHDGVLAKRAGTQIFGYMVHSSTTTAKAITNADPGQITVADPTGLVDGTWFQIRNAAGMTEINNQTYMIENLVGATFDIVNIYGESLDTSAFGVYAGLGDLFIVPKLPIMGIKTFIDTASALQLLIFDTERAAIFNSGTNVFDPIDIADIFAGTASSFISSTSFGRTQSFATCTFYFTNFNGDVALPISPMRLFTTGAATTTFIPDTTPTLGTRNYIISSQFIFNIRQRLLLLNTVESDTLPVGVPPIGSGTNYAQRMRWSRANNPAATGSNWDEVTPGNGGFVDAPTSEVIIGATQLQDLIIVQFTNSLWAIEPTADPALPLRWTKINSYRACDAPYANIGHDRYIISFGKRGIVACDRVEVKRIDNKIELFMFDEINADFINRMYSERNYTNKRSWTLYPAIESETSDFALIHTEEEGAWSMYDVAMRDVDPDNGTNMSCLGFGEVSQDLSYQDMVGSLDRTFEEFSDEMWSSFFLQGNSEVFLGGDQISRILILESKGDDLGQPISTEIVSAGWNPFKEQGIQTQMGYVDFYVDADEDTNFTVEFFADDMNSPYSSQIVNCLPNLGFIADIQNILLTNPVQVVSTSHGLTTGQQIFIYDVTGSDEISGGPYTITKIDKDNFTLDGVDGTTFVVYGGGGQIVERAFENVKCWKRAYAGGKGYQHYIRITNTGTDDVLRFSGFMPWFKPAGNRMIGG